MISLDTLPCRLALRLHLRLHPLPLTTSRLTTRLLHIIARQHLLPSIGNSSLLRNTLMLRTRLPLVDTEGLIAASALGLPVLLLLLAV